MQIERIAAGSRAGLESLYLPLIAPPEYTPETGAQSSSPSPSSSTPDAANSSSSSSSSSGETYPPPVQSTLGTVGSRDSYPPLHELAEIQLVSSISSSSSSSVLSSATWRQSNDPGSRQALFTHLPPALMVKVGAVQAADSGGGGADVSQL
jgi:hypothetical protein